MTKQTIIIRKPRIMKMKIQNIDNVLHYEWKDLTSTVDYRARQNQLKQLLKQFNINISYYLKKVSLSKSKYYTTMKNQDDNPVTNYKIHLIYLLIKQDYLYILNQYALVRQIINSKLCSISDYSKLSSLSKQTVTKIRNNTFTSYQHKTFEKIETANIEIQKNLLKDIRKDDNQLFSELSQLGVVEFYQQFFKYQSQFK